MSDELGTVAQVMNKASATKNYHRPGLKSITPSLMVRDAAALIKFLKFAFGGVEQLRIPDEDGSVTYAEVAIGNGAVEVGEARPAYPAAAAAIHLYVDDADATYAGAIQAGATAVSPVEDQPWGDRQGTVKDAFGNKWYIAEAGSWGSGMEGVTPVQVSSVQPFLHLLDADGMIPFAAAAFGAESLGAARSPEGLILHDTLSIGNATFELDDSRAGNEPMPCYLHVYVPDTDTAYHAALKAGASSIDAPETKPHGDRSATVMDRWGNRWFISTYLFL